MSANAANGNQMEKHCVKEEIGGERVGGGNTPKIIKPKINGTKERNIMKFKRKNLWL